MERLTERKTSCWIRLKNGSEYTNYHKDWDAISKLAGYEDAEEQGLLIRMPCKVGDTLYEASSTWKTVITRTVASIVICENSIWIRNGCGDSFEYGVEVFLTCEEAEKALERMGEG